MQIFGTKINWVWWQFSIAVLLFRLEYFFAMVVACFVHEVGHAFVGHRLGYIPKKISVGPLTGCVEFDEDIMKMRPSDRFSIAIAGPLANILLGLATILISLVFGYDKIVLTIILFNLFCAFGNLVSVAPCDGWHVSNAIFEHLTKSKDVSIIISYMIGTIELLIITYIFDLWSSVWWIFSIAPFYVLNLLVLSLSIGALYETNNRRNR